MKYFDRLEDGYYAQKAVYVGYDPKEDHNAKMLAHSIRVRTKAQFPIIPIVRDELLAHNMFNRKLDPNGSTQFSITRFLVPQLMNFCGIGLFLDCDMLITRDIMNFFNRASPDFAVHVPKHKYIPSTTSKMGGIPQTSYPRKQWSAVTMYNCSHKQNKNLTRDLVEKADPKYLHRFQWLDDDVIGDFPLEYNFLVGEQSIPEKLPMNIHHTLGAPNFKNSQNVDFDNYWRNEFYATFGRKFDPTKDFIDG